MRLRYRKSLVMMLTNTFKENVVNRLGLRNHEISFHREDENCFLVNVSNDTSTTIVRVTDFGIFLVMKLIVVSIHHDRGTPSSGLEILNSMERAIAAETGKNVRIMKS
jgi:hypothetical protein